jgi:GntR family transcriptional repressor for pyruvate dehydrogenase complex
MKISQIQKTKIYKDIVEQIKTSILRREIQVGNQLPTERDLARQFGVSRVSVRQALTVLHEMGLVQSRPGGGTFVSGGLQDLLANPLAQALLAERELLQEPLEVRRIIEPEVTRLAALRARSKDLTEMERLISLQEATATTNVPITEEDTLFHEAIAKATKNAILIKLVQSLHQQLRASRHQSLIVPRGNSRSIEDHKKIFAAISKRDGQGAYEAMVQHLKNVESLISQALGKKK